MAVAETGRERTRRRRWLTGLVVAGISVTALAVGVTYWVRTHRPTTSTEKPPSVAAGIDRQASGYTFTRSEQGHPVFTVHAGKTVSYQQGKSTVLEDVRVEVYGRKGDSGDTLQTHTCEYDPASGDFIASGPVQLELSAHASDIPGSGIRGKHKITLETSGVTYQQRSQIAQTDELVKFRVGPASGTARGLNYAIHDGWLELKHDVVVDLLQQTGKTPPPPMHLTAAGLRYDKEGGRVTLAGPVEVTQDKLRTRADGAVVELNDRNQVSRIDLNGHAQAFDADPMRTAQIQADRVQGDFDPATGQLRHLTAENNVVGESRGKASISRLTARRVDMEMTAHHPQPLQGVAKGDVRLSVESQPVLNVAEKTAAGEGPEKRSLTANEVKFDFRPETHGLKEAETVGPGTLTISPADPKSGERVITAGQLLMFFDTRSRIESLRGTAPTQVVFHPPATAPAGTSSPQSQADRLDAMFDPGTQTLREVRQSGNFQYRDGDRRASADEARYATQAQTMVLLGHPQVWDADSRVKAQKISIDLRTNTSVGEGKVQATHMRSPAPGAPAPSTPPLPTNVLADKVVAEQQSQTIHYEGHVRAWQGTDVVESTALDVFRLQKRISSGARVLTSFMQPASMVSGQGAPPPAKEETTPVIIQADHLEYLDEGKRARYHGNVRLVTQSTTLQSDRLDVYLTQGDTPESSQVDHAEADGHVKVTQPGRVGTGNHAEYFAGPGKVVLTGGPPLIVDEEKGSTTGQRLTFFIHDDRLFVDGGDKSPSTSEHRVAP